MTAKLLISFPDQSQSFTYGVEYGRLLERFEKGIPIINNNGLPIRIENFELIKTTCKVFGYVFVSFECGVDGWIDFEAIKRSSNDC